MKLADMLQELKDYKIQGSDQIEILNLSHNTQWVSEGTLFFAIRGQSRDGHEFISQAIEKQAAALVVSDESKVPSAFQGAVITVSDTKKALDTLALKFYNVPSNELFCFGVTGTNGKTSTTYLIEHIMNQMGAPIGVIGTVEHRLESQTWATNVTTPDSLLLIQRMREMRHLGAKSFVMEVSSHALDQGRVSTVDFNVAIFTNLTRDHLDYHKTEEDYFLAKQKLFTEKIWNSRKMVPFAIVNTDDKYGRRLKVAAPAVLWTFGQNENADFRFKILDMSFASTLIELKSPFGELKTEIPLCGEHNVYNVVGAVAATAAAGILPQAAFDKLKTFTGVPGRLQKVISENSNKNVFIDYAHTPDALEKILKALKAVNDQQKTKGQVVVVMGCGGDRDKGKRPLMASISEAWAHKVFVTSDNPRTEDPEAILQDIKQGFKDPSQVDFEVDREQSIKKAIAYIQSNDVLVIAGKGHEDYQIIGTHRYPFSDYLVAQSYLK